MVLTDALHSNAARRRTCRTARKRQRWWESCCNGQRHGYLLRTSPRGFTHDKPCPENKLSRASSAGQLPKTSSDNSSAGQSISRTRPSRNPPAAELRPIASPIAPPPPAISDPISCGRSPSICYLAFAAPPAPDQKTIHPPPKPPRSSPIPPLDITPPNSIAPPTTTQQPPPSPPLLRPSANTPVHTQTQTHHDRQHCSPRCSDECWVGSPTASRASPC